MNDQPPTISISDPGALVAAVPQMLGDTTLIDKWVCLTVDPDIPMLSIISERPTSALEARFVALSIARDVIQNGSRGVLILDYSEDEGTDEDDANLTLLAATIHMTGRAVHDVIVVSGGRYASASGLSGPIPEPDPALEATIREAQEQEHTEGDDQ